MKVPVSGDEEISLSSYLDEESSPWWGYVIGFPGMIISGVKSLFAEEDSELIISKKANQGAIELSGKELQKIESLKKKIIASVDKKTSMTTVSVTVRHDGRTGCAYRQNEFHIRSLVRFGTGPLQRTDGFLRDMFLPDQSGICHQFDRRFHCFDRLINGKLCPRPCRRIGT